MLAAPAATTTSTVQQGGAFPPFETQTYPGQLFWLAITFAVLFVVLARIAGPRIASVIGERKGRIANDLAGAEKHRSDAEATLAAYESALAEARGRARTLAEESRKLVDTEVEKAKAEADAAAAEASAKAEAQIAASRAEAAQHVTKMAQDAAVEIVAHLIGERVAPDEAEAAVKAGAG
jgi:F-type H+-transporting ATPase subunit b